MNDFNVGDNAWFIIKGSDGGWMSVQRRITRVLGDTEPIYYGCDDVSAPAERLCGSAAEAFMWISKHLHG